MQAAIGYALANQMGAEDVARFMADAFLKALSPVKPLYRTAAWPHCLGAS